MSTVEVEIKLLPVCRDNNGNPIIPLEEINIKNKVKYIKEKAELLFQRNKSTVDEREIDIQLTEIKGYLDRVMNGIVTLKNEYKNKLDKGYSKEKLEEEYGCTQGEWESNFTYSDTYNIEDSLRNHLRYLEHSIKVLYPTGFSKYFNKDYHEDKNYIDATKNNIQTIVLFVNSCLRLLSNMENVINDLQQKKQTDQSPKENVFIEPSKDSIATYLNRLYTALKSCDPSQIEAIKEFINSSKNWVDVFKNSNLFIRKAISFGSVKKAEEVFLMNKAEWDDFVKNCEKMDFSELNNKLLNIYGNILEYTKKENMGREEIDALERFIASIKSTKNLHSLMLENIDKIESAVRIETDRYISPEVRREVWRRDQGRCVQCGSQLNLEFDHIIPVSKGGSNTSRNIQLLCENCNREKYNNI